MTKSKAIGTKAEGDVLNAFHERGYHALHRLVMRGGRDEGDLGGLPNWCIEVKAAKAMALAEWMGELEVEKRNAGTDHGVLIHKRRGKGALKWYATMQLEDLIGVLDVLGLLHAQPVECNRCNPRQ